MFLAMFSVKTHEQNFTGFQKTEANVAENA